MSLPRALSIAGSDSGGGAGLQADLKTFQELDVFGMSVVTALTAQNTLGVQAVQSVSPDFVRQQLEAVLEDLGTDAAKTGMLGNRAVVETVAEALRRYRVRRLVVDPVCVSKHGDPLLDSEGLEALKRELIPLAEILTPNLDEVRLLTGLEVREPSGLRAAAEALHALGPRFVLVKGGHLGEGPALDLLFDGETSLELSAPRLPARDSHGTGCTLAAALTAFRARGLSVEDAARRAKAWLTGALRGALRLGEGIGPLDHGWERRARS